MTVSYIGGDTQSSGAAQSLTMTIPAGAQSGDFMLAFMKQSENITPQNWNDDGGGGNGWVRQLFVSTTSGRDQDTAVYSKIHDGSEPNPTFTWPGGSNEQMTGILLVYRSSNSFAADPILDITQINGQNDCNPPNSPVTITNPAANIVVFHAATHDDISSVGAPSGYQIREFQYGGSAQHSLDHRDSFSADLLNATLSAGNYTPPDWGHGAANTTPEWTTYTVYFEEQTVIGITDLAPTGTILDGTTITLTGFNFEAVQGTGLVELADGADYGTATKVTQSTSLSWSDTSISFDLSEGSITWGTRYFFVTNDTGDRTNAFSFVFGEPPPVLLEYPCVLLSTTDEAWIVGQNFEAARGTGDVWLADDPDFATATKVTQTPTSWSGELIKFDVTNTTGLSNGLIYLFVETNNGQINPIAPILLGTSTMQNYIDNILNPDHYHSFDNTAEDLQNASQAWNSATTGTPVFVADPITRDNTHSYDYNGVTDKAERPNSSLVNTATIQRRQLCIVFRLDQVSTGLGLIYEEGGGVNNIYWSVGFGNKLLSNFSDENDFEIQCYSDKALKANRVYMTTNIWEGTAFRNIAEQLLGGILQSDSAGNPPDRSFFSSHSGDLALGDSASLNTGGTDINYQAALMNVAHWATWAGNENSGGNMVDSFVPLHWRLCWRLGAPADTTVPAGTQSVMQTWVENNLDGTSISDAATCVDISDVTGGGDLSLDMTDQDYDADSDFYINWLGDGVLTLVNIGSTNITYDKVNSTAGGGIVIQNPATFTISNIIAGSEVRIYDDETPGDGQYNTELAGIESNVGTTFQYSHDGSSNDIIVQVILDGYIEIIRSFSLSSSDQTLTINQQVDNFL